MEGIKDVLEKISSYNIFNYLLPGTLFVFISRSLGGYNLVQDNVLISIFLYYFIGMIISRFGSIFIEPFLKKIKFLKFADYKDFVIACRVDSKIELLSEVNNTYRTISSMLLLLLLSKFFIYLKIKYGINRDVSVLIVIIIMFIIFLYSYRKQTNYITKRVKANIQP